MMACFISMPFDVTSRILLGAGWRSVLRIRPVSKAMKQLTQTRSLWISIIKADQTSDILSPAFEFPLSHYSTQDLESLYLRWKRASYHWLNIGNPDHTVLTALSLPEEEVNQMVLVPGGRWLLLSTKAWTVVYIDLSSSDRNVRALIPTQVEASDRRFPCHGDMVISDTSIQEDGSFSFMVGVVFAWLERGPTGSEEEQELMMNAVIQAWRVEHEIPETGFGRTPTGLEASNVSSAAVTDPSSDDDAGFAVISRAYMLYYSKKPYLDGDFRSTILRLHLKTPSAAHQAIDITGSPPVANTFTFGHFIRFVNESCALHVRENKAIIVRHSTSTRPPFTSVLYSLDIPEYIHQIAGRSQLSETFKVGTTTRLTLFYADKVWGISIPNACLVTQETEICEEPQIFVLSRLPSIYADMFTIARLCAYRHVLLGLTQRGRYILVEFSWPDDDFDGEGVLTTQNEVAPTLFCIKNGGHVARYGELVDEWDGIWEGDGEMLTEVQLYFVPPPLLAVDEVSGQIAVHERGVAYVARVR